MRIGIIGAGVAGLTTAVEFASRGIAVDIFERAASLGPHNCSWFAGGMLAPWCELESAEPLIATLGEESIAWWLKHYPNTVRNGSLVLTQGRDAADLARFAQRTTHHERLNHEAIAALEPDLAGRFHQALYFADEAQLDPRKALAHLAQKIVSLGGQLQFDRRTSVAELSSGDSDFIIDCTGLSARAALPQLRGVKGEMLLLHSTDVQLHRPIRMLHPRIPVYIAPRDAGLFMVGATMIESDDDKHISARSMLELLSAAYALHPAFGEAEIVEIGTQVRPAFADNLPRIVKQGRNLHVNGFYRHGYLVAPALARMTADIVLHDRFFPEVMDEHPRQRKTA